MSATNGQAGGNAAAINRGDIIVECSRRFANEPSLRKLHGVHTANPEEPVYKAKLARFIEAEQKCQADQATPAVIPDAETEGDSVSRALRTPGATYKAD